MGRYSSKEMLYPIDKHIGKRIRLRRRVLQMTQKQFADLMGVTFQQVQKYEIGQNRIGAARLWNIAQILNVPTDFFFTDITVSVDDKPATDLFVDPMQKNEAIELVRNYYRINNRQLARYFFETLREMVQSHI